MSRRTASSLPLFYSCHDSCQISFILAYFAYIFLHYWLVRRGQRDERKALGIKDLRVVAGEGFEPSTFRL